MISNKFVIDKAKAIADAGGLSELELAQLTDIKNQLPRSIYTVNNKSDLPNAANNRGRFAYVISTNLYYFSNGVNWVNDYNYIEPPPVITETLYAWGQNSYGKLGDTTMDDRLSPVSVVGGITNWSQVSAGDIHSLGITTDGVAYAWGYNLNGQLGDNTTSSRLSPVSVVGGLTWKQVGAGSMHSLGLTTDGKVYAWGDNTYGQIGDNTTSSYSSPVSVVGGLTWKQVSAGGNHSLGLTTNGKAYAWGYNWSGQLGDNTEVFKSSPVSVVGGITNWSQVSAGSTHSLGITTDGKAYAWGGNFYGQLGDTTTISSASPVSVVGGITNWSQVSAGGSHNLGLTTNGIAYAWGHNLYGQLGDNTTTPRRSPVSVVGGITNWSQVSAGGMHSLGITTDGIAYAWGRNNNGQTGDSTTSDRSSPVSVVGGITNWSQLSAGSFHSLGIEVK